MSTVFVRLRPALLVLCAFLAVSLLVRVALAARPEFTSVPASDILRSFLVGFCFDAAAGIYALAPFAFWLLLAPNFIARSRAYRAISLSGFAIAMFAVLLLATAEWLFWEEFGGRFNFIAVDYLLYTHEVLGNIWESYPAGKLLIALALAALAFTAAIARPLWRWSGAPIGMRTAMLTLALLVISVAGLVRYADSDQKNVSSRDISNELAGNGLYEFFSALRRNELDFERHYATLDIDRAFSTVRRALPDSNWIESDAAGIERYVPGAGGERKLNVILVSVESLGAEFLGAYGDRRGLTPNLDRLAAESLWFSKVYATGNRTVRGLEALSLALPPTPGQSIVRRPNNGKLFSLGSVFEDKEYAVVFAYGGYGYFDNMNAFFDANDYRSIDRRSIPAEKIEFENIWGVADEHLYDEVLDQIDREKIAQPGRPVFAHVMTTSNHRPYTYPAGRIDIPSGSGREGAVKYTDYAIGRLLEKARARPWFRDTVFVITADHGASARGTSQIPLEKYLIPLFVYSPAHVPPGRVDRLMSQIDLAPTLLGLLDFRYFTKFLGRDLMHAAPEGDRAFVANFQTLAYLKAGQLMVLQPKRRVNQFAVEGGRQGASSQIDASFREEAIAFYQVASHVYREGLYLDEEQIVPSARPALALAGQNSRRTAAGR